MAVMLSGLEHSLAPIALREALSFTNARTADLDRAIAALSLPDADDQTAQTLFQQLDALEASLQRQVAEALKAFWQASGKWQGKQLSKKQKEKVARIRSLLGE